MLEIELVLMMDEMKTAWQHTAPGHNPQAQSRHLEADYAGADESTTRRHGGFNVDRQDARRALRRNLVSKDHALGDFFSEAHRLKLTYARQIMQLGPEDVILELPLLGHVRTLLSRVIPLRAPSQRGTSSNASASGAQPTETELVFPNYTQLLKDDGVLSWPEDHFLVGRKAPTWVEEAEMPGDDDEIWSVAGWAHYWCRLGGFSSIDETDQAGWTPLHHAIDSATFSHRALFAAMDLIDHMSSDYLNKQTLAPSQQCRIARVPVGWTALHFAADGSTKRYSNRELVHKLADAKADLNICDSNGNTPLHLAVSTGVQDAVVELVSFGANVHLTNKRKKGILELAQSSSTSVRMWIEQHTTAQRTEGNPPSRDRSGSNMSRAKILRHATSTRSNALIADHEEERRAKRQKGKGAGRDKGKGKGKGKDRRKGKRK